MAIERQDALCGRELGRVDDLRAGIKRGPNAHWNLAPRLGARIRQFVDRLAAREERLMLGPVVEIHAVDIVDKSLSRRVLREDQRVVVGFDMIIDKDLWHFRLADDRRPVDQRPCMDQQAIDEKRMIGREQEIAARSVVAERPGLDADRLRPQRIGEAARDRLHAKPGHRNHPPVSSDDKIAAHKGLDGNLALRRRDHRASAKARHAGIVDVHPVVGRVRGAGRENAAGPIGVDAGVGRRGQIAAGDRRREIVAGVRIFAGIGMIGGDVGRAGRDRDRGRRS